MALGTPSAPARFGGGQVGVTNRELFLDVFGGEVMTAFDLSTLTLDKHTIKSVSGGARSWRFPKVWKATSEYHTPGQELLGTDIDTTEVTVTVDDILVSHVALSDLDQMLSHFETRGPFSQAMGRELAKVFDKNVFRQLFLTARAPADGPFPGGSTLANDGLKPIDPNCGVNWLDAIRDANRALYNKDVPDTEMKYLAVSAEIYDAIKWAKDANGQYLILDRSFHRRPDAPDNAGGIVDLAEYIDFEGTRIYRSRNMPNTDETLDTTVYSKYRADYSKALGIMWTPSAVATVKVMDIGFETTRDTRRLEDFMVAKMLVGHGTLRPECAYEFDSVT